VGTSILIHLNLFSIIIFFILIQFKFISHVFNLNLFLMYET